jgi:hypothetical protein
MAVEEATGIGAITTDLVRRVSSEEKTATRQGGFIVLALGQRV